MSRATPKKSKSTAPTETVSPSWLLKAISLVLLAAALCTWLTLCLLFYRGQWQLVLHPVHRSAAPPASAETIRFGPDESATPQLTGIWLPTAPGARYATTTILFLPAGDGSLTDSNPTIEALHQIGLNIFAFDYRGYGSSANTHPSQQTMAQDAESAWRYLTATRGINPGNIIPYGTGVGASLATQLALSHLETPAIILDSPLTDLLEVVRRDPRTSLVPVRLLFHEDFPLAAPLAMLRTPKLLITTVNKPSAAFRTAIPPKIAIELNAIPGSQYQEAITRFLDQYLPHSPAPLVPTQAPFATNSR
jgi:uncharacterized protein